jgi:hypothetical protein
VVPAEHPLTPAPHSSPGTATPQSGEFSPTAPDIPPPQRSLSRAQVWLHRLLVLVFVFVCAAAGVLLVILPWLPQWTDNILLLRYPELRPVVSSGFFRGWCSGLGLLDIWIGFSEAIHYHEDTPA